MEIAYGSGIGSYYGISENPPREILLNFHGADIVCVLFLVRGGRRMWLL